MKKVLFSLTIVGILLFCACDGKKTNQDITNTDSIASETVQAEDETPFLDDNTTPLNDEELMQAQAICGQWGWVDTDKEDDFPLLLTLEMVDDQLAVFSCALHGSTIGEMTPQCSYRNGVLKIEDKNEQRHMKVQLELNPRGDFVGIYYLKLNPDNISEGNLTLRQGYYKYGDNNEEE
jgi:hypothetical protein